MKTTLTKKEVQTSKMLLKIPKEELSGQFDPDQDDLDSESFLETLSKELNSENNTEDNNALLKEDLRKITKI